MGFAELRRRIHNFGRPKAPPSDILNEASRVALASDTIRIDQVLSIVRSPRFDMLAPYFALKLLGGDPQRQRHALSAIANGIHTSGTYSAAVACIADMGQDAQTNALTVSPKKLSRVALGGPLWMEERMDGMIGEVQLHETPTLIAYAGLFGIRPAIRQMQDGADLLIVIPDNLPYKEKPAGYKITKQDAALDVAFLTDADLQTMGTLFVVDDLIRTGDTFREVERAFPQATFRSPNR